MSRRTRRLVVALIAGAGVARAQPAGDPTPGTMAPLVAIVNPMDGAVVGQPWRVQVRVQHPSGLSAIASVTLAISGSGGGTVALSPNTKYSRGADRGIYEASVTADVGSHELVATVTDTSARA